MKEYYQTERIGSGLFRIRDVANTSCYLVCGSKQAMVIDTGIGLGSMCQVVAGLTDLPVTVLLTHGHLDHALGCRGFSQVYLSPLDWEIYLEGWSTDVRMGYIRGAALQGGDPKAIAQARADELLPPLSCDELYPLAPGDRFNLGGVNVEIHEGAGHTPGCVTVLLPEFGTLILGDACNNFTYLFDRRCPTVSQYQAMLRRLQEAVSGRYDRVLLSHGPGEGAPDMIDSVIQVCQDVLEGQTAAIPFQGLGGQLGLIAKEMDFQRFTRRDGGSGNLVYRPDRL